MLTRKQGSESQLPNDNSLSKFLVIVRILSQSEPQGTTIYVIQKSSVTPAKKSWDWEKFETKGNYKLF